jgi:GNAT superfamily N-acetyltransferase
MTLMKELIIRNYTAEDIFQVIEVQKQYKKKYPNYSIRGKDVYTDHPMFENGKNIFCVFDLSNKLIAYSPIVPAPVNDDSDVENPHYLWTDIIFDPFVENIEESMDLLLKKIIERAIEKKASFSQRKTRLASLKFVEEQKGIRYYLSKGFENYDTVYSMNRDLSEAIVVAEFPDDIQVKRWKITTEEDKLKYIYADNLSNPESPISREDLEWNLKKAWSVGSAIAAFDKNGQLVGSVMAYWFDKEKGITEEIFVLPAWRKKGFAQSLVREALVYLKEYDKTSAELEVRKSNEKAINLYKKLGYEIVQEECSLGLYI